MRSAAVVIVVACAGALTISPAARASDIDDADKGGGDDADKGGGAGGVDRLVDALRTSDSFKVRATAAVALGHIGDPRAAPALENALRSDDHYAVRLAAAAALGRLPTTEGIPALLVALHDQDQFVREEANGALDRFHTTASVFAFRDALESEDAASRLAAVRAYGDVLRENQELAPIVVNALADDNDEVSHAADTALAGIPHERAVPVLVAALSSGGSAVRAACARLLAKRADQSAVEPLIVMLMDIDDVDDVHAAAKDALKAHRDYLDLPARRAAAADTSPEAKDKRIEALRVLAAVGDASAAGLVETALKDKDPTVRVAAARAAVDLGGDGARRMLLAAKAKETDARMQKQLELLLNTLR